MTRLRRRSGTKEYLNSQKDFIILQPEPLRGKWKQFFGNDHPIHVELGMGKGQFIAEMSVRNPGINFIGIDIYDELIRKASEKAYELAAQATAKTADFADAADSADSAGESAGESSMVRPPNLALVRFNIEKLEQVFAEGEIARFYLNFSDPWPKNRHAHRRLTHPNFMNKYMPMLAAGGDIHLRTDSRSLFEFSLNTFADMRLHMRNISLDLHGAENTPPDHVFTEYEQKFMDKGMPIYHCEVVKG